MSCDVCDISVLFQRPGSYGVCRHCGDEYGWLEVDVDELRTLVDGYARLAIDADEPEDGFLLRQRRLKEAHAELHAFLWDNRYGLRNAALLAERAREESESREVPPLRYDYTMRDAEWP
jgi:hypothetical protein